MRELPASFSTARWHTQLEFFYTHYLSIILSIYHSIYHFIYLSIILSIYLSIYLSFYLSVYLSIYHSTYLSFYLSIYLSINLSIILSISLLFYQSVYQSIYLSIHTRQSHLQRIRRYWTLFSGPRGIHLRFISYTSKFLYTKWNYLVHSRMIKMDSTVSPFSFFEPLIFLNLPFPLLLQTFLGFLFALIVLK